MAPHSDRARVSSIWNWSLRDPKTLSIRIRFPDARSAGPSPSSSLGTGSASNHTRAVSLWARSGSPGGPHSNPPTASTGRSFCRSASTANKCPRARRSPMSAGLRTKLQSAPWFETSACRRKPGKTAVSRESIPLRPPTSTPEPTSTAGNPLWHSAESTINQAAEPHEASLNRRSLKDDRCPRKQVHSSEFAGSLPTRFKGTPGPPSPPRGPVQFSGRPPPAARPSIRRSCRTERTPPGAPSPEHPVRPPFL